MKNVTKVGLLLLCGGLLLAGYCYFEFIYKGTPEYIHKHSTLAYEEEAKNYFEQNGESLYRLAELRTKIGPGQWYLYKFHDHEYDTPDIPKEFQSVLSNLERRSKENYEILMYSDKIVVFIGSGWRFQVILYHADVPYEALMPEWDKKTELGGGWEIHAPYVLGS